MQSFSLLEVGLGGGGLLPFISGNFMLRLFVHCHTHLSSLFVH